MYQQEDLLPSNRNYTLLIGCVTLIFTITIIGVLISFTGTNSQDEDVSLFVAQSTKPQGDLTAYNQDSDRDLIPNFIEDEAILNTYLPETSYCEQSNPTCSTNPFQNEYHISIILDSSTSMNIPAGNTTKIDLVKGEMTKVLNDSINENFIKTQLIGFGNNGNLSFIAENQSCVSNINFKNFSQVLKSKETSPLVLSSYVPNGKSPIGYSLEQAEKSFPNKQGNNLVIIVTDGVDDCGYDVNSTIKGVLARGTVKKINIISVFAPQDESQKLREAAESNGGSYTSSAEIANTINNWKSEFMLTNWCKYKDTQKQFACLDNNYQKAFTVLQEKIKSDTPQNVQSKIREIESSSGLLIQNYQNSKNQQLEEEFNKLYKDFFETSNRN